MCFEVRESFLLSIFQIGLAGVIAENQNLADSISSRFSGISKPLGTKNERSHIHENKDQRDPL